MPSPSLPRVNCLSPVRTWLQLAFAKLSVSFLLPYAVISVMNGRDAPAYPGLIEEELASALARNHDSKKLNRMG